MVARSAVSRASVLSFLGSRLDQSLGTHGYPVCLSGTGLERKSGPQMGEDRKRRKTFHRHSPLPAPTAPVSGAGGALLAIPSHRGPALWPGASPPRPPGARLPGLEDCSWVNSGGGCGPATDAGSPPSR